MTPQERAEKIVEDIAWFPFRAKRERVIEAIRVAQVENANVELERSRSAER